MSVLGADQWSKEYSARNISGWNGKEEAFYTEFPNFIVSVYLVFQYFTFQCSPVMQLSTVYCWIIIERSEAKSSSDLHQNTLSYFCWFLANLESLQVHTGETDRRLWPCISPRNNFLDGYKSWYQGKCDRKSVIRLDWLPL